MRVLNSHQGKRTFFTSDAHSSKIKPQIWYIFMRHPQYDTRQTHQKFKTLQNTRSSSCEVLCRLWHLSHTLMESVFLSRFTMNNIAPKLQKCWTHKIAFKIIFKTLKQPNFFLLYFHRMHLQSFIFLRVKFYDTFCSPYPIINFLHTFNYQNRKP